MGVAALVVSVVAVLVAGWAAVRSDRHAKRSADAAERAARAAEESNRRPSWSLERGERNVYRLRNTSGRRAHHVEVRSGAPAVRLGGEPKGETIDDGAEWTFTIVIGLVVDIDRSVTVRATFEGDSDGSTWVTRI